MEIVGGTLGMGGGAENQPVVVAQGLGSPSGYTAMQIACAR
jgi:hypothetical protein